MSDATAPVTAALLNAPTLSFEFFPPKTPAAADRLAGTVERLLDLEPAFVSVTYGAGGTTRTTTFDTVVELNEQVPTVAHLTCVGHTVAEIDAMLDRYQAAGVRTILALGGDPPRDGQAAPTDFEYAIDLVSHIKARGVFEVGVAAHPEGHPRSPSMAEDRRRLAAKLEVADFAVTQFFFEVEVYQRMMDELATHDVTTPILPGVIPVTNPGQVTRFADLAGASVPGWLTDRIAAVADDPDAVIALGVELAASLIDDLVAAGAPGIHLYSLNRAAPARAVVQASTALARR